jgi:hypothetical protein
MLVKVYVYNYSLTIDTMQVIFRGDVYIVAKKDVVRSGDDITVDETKLTEQTKVQTSNR